MSQDAGVKIICDNRKASHNYYLEERFEAGMVLTGTEVKSLRGGKANIRDAYAVFKNNELFLVNSHINPYEQGNRANHEPLRTRKLLLKRSELNKIWKESEIKGMNLIPTKLYFKKGLAKCEVALAKSKKAYDKRLVEREKESKRSMDRAMKAIRR